MTLIKQYMTINEMKNKIFQRGWYYFLLPADSGQRFYYERMRGRLCVHIPEITRLEFHTDEGIHRCLQVLTAAGNSELHPFGLQPANVGSAIA